MEQWEAKWLKEFNLDQCEIVTVANKMSYVNYLNNTHAKELAHVQHAKYLGLLVTIADGTPTSITCHLCLLEQKYEQLLQASKCTMFHNARTS
jgi:hypothetical protein